MKFRAHETFSIRKNWLAKGIKGINNKPDIFTAKDTGAMDYFGIGRNMVLSLRYWLRAVGIGTEEKNPNTKGKIIIGDSRTVNIGEKLQQFDIDKVQFIIYHPPYWDIIKFSDNKNDLSNCETLNDFLDSFGQVIDNTSQYLEKNRYCAVVIGDKYANSEIVPLGFYCMNLFMMRGFKMKAILVKNFDETKGKANQKAIWRYRALASDFYLFKHEYIFVFKKTKQ